MHFHKLIIYEKGGGLSGERAMQVTGEPADIGSGRNVRGLWEDAVAFVVNSAPLVKLISLMEFLHKHK